MKERYKRYIKINLVSLIFLAISFISITLAWFAYSGIANSSLEIGVKAWNLEFKKGDTSVSNNIVISLSDVYPGMQTVSEIVDIKNYGDSDAQISYSILSARILNDELEQNISDNLLLEDYLAHEYPFHININLSKEYALAHDGQSKFEVSVSWPLDSGNDELDSQWGNDSYAFIQQEQANYNNDPSYQIRSQIKIVISIKAEQYVSNNDAIDVNYNLGDLILFDVVNNSVCSEISDTCLQTHILDIDNTLGDSTVALLPTLYDTYIEGTYDNFDNLMSTVTSSWNVNTRNLNVTDLLKPISKDILNSYIIRDNLSDTIIGKLNNDDRINSIINLTKSSNGYFKFLNGKYNYLVTSKCYWLNNEYDTNSAFALTKIDSTNSKIYGEVKTSTCSIVPVIIASKTNIDI